MKTIYFSPSKQPNNAYCVGNTNEKAEMEQLAANGKTILESEYDCTVVMATLDMGIELTGRPTEAKNKGCEVYIAFHSNSGTGSSTGAIGLYNPNSEISKALATNIVNELNAVCPIKSNRAEPIQNGMLAFNGAGYGEIRSPEQLGIIPALIETNFHDNPATAQYILDKKDDIARAYVNGIAKTFSLARKVVPVIVAPVVQAFPGTQYFGANKCNNYILMLDRQLIAKGYAKYYQLGVNGASNTWGNGTLKAVRAFQQNQGWSGSGADGIPGPLTWLRLFK